MGLNVFYKIFLTFNLNVENIAQNIVSLCTPLIRDKWSTKCMHVHKPLDLTIT